MWPLVWANSKLSTTGPRGPRPVALPDCGTVGFSATTLVYLGYAMLSYIQENENVLLILGIVSVVSFLATLVFIPWVVLRIPADYFSKPRRVSLVSSSSHPSLKILVFIAKNLFGFAVVLLGIAMLVLPGQGLLTILIGVVLIDFPGKYKFQRWLISREPVLKSTNWLREKGHKKPLII